MTTGSTTSTPGPERSEGPDPDLKSEISDFKSQIANRKSQIPDPPVPFQQLQVTRASPYSRNEKIRRVVWNLARAVLFRPSPKRCFRWRNVVLRWFGARIGPNTFIEPTVRIFHPWLLTIGDWTHIGGGANLYSLGPISIGDHSVVSQDAFLCAGTHDYTHPNLPLLRPPVAIGSGVWVAVEAFIAPGVTVGDNSVVGARAVVGKDVPPGVVVAGNPARVIKQRPMAPRPG